MFFYNLCLNFKHLYLNKKKVNFYDFYIIRKMFEWKVNTTSQKYFY